MNHPTVHINTDRMNMPVDEKDLFAARQAAYKNCNSRSTAIITILVVAYNRLEKTRRCVESILNHTKGIDYELLLEVGS